MIVLEVLKKIIKIFHLPIIFIAVIAYFVCFALGLNVKYGSFPFAVLHVVVFTTLAYSVVRLIFVRVEKKSKNNKKTKNVKKSTSCDAETVKQQKTPPKQQKTVYYSVKQDPRYVFAEYDDRYELFLKTSDGLKYVKTDYKK